MWRFLWIYTPIIPPKISFSSCTFWAQSPHQCTVHNFLLKTVHCYICREALNLSACNLKLTAHWIEITHIMKYVSRKEVFLEIHLSYPPLVRIKKLRSKECDLFKAQPISSRAEIRSYWLSLYNFFLLLYIASVNDSEQEREYSHWENVHSFIRNGEENKASDTDVFVIIFQCSLSQNTCLQKAFVDVHNFLQCYVTGQSVQK